MAVVGRIARAHGIRGQVIVNLETDFPHERFRPGVKMFVSRDGQMEALTITTVRFQHERPVLGVEGVDDMNSAIRLAGAELRVPAAELSELPKGAYYRHDLVGCAVDTTAGQRVGTVSAVEGTFGASRLVVEGSAGEVLIPLADDICRVIDPDGKRIVIDPPDGLLDLNGRSRAL